MKRNIVGMVWLAIVLVLASPSNGADPAIDTLATEINSPKSVSFSLSGVNYTFKLPKEFCITSGRDSELAATIASLDPRNMTHFTIIMCKEAGRNADFTRWGMLKTPKGSIGKRIPTRKLWVKDARDSIRRRDFPELFADAEKVAGKIYKDVFGDEAKIGMHMEMVDADEYAGYMTGTFSLSIAGRNVLVAGAGALTVVRGNVFFYYKYGPYNDLADLANLLKQVKSEIRGFVTDNPD